MREQLIQYVELLFAGAPNSTEIKQEILQNTLDRFDDLVSQGKSEDAAYRLAISGIGDINEVLGRAPDSSCPAERNAAPAEDEDPVQARKTRAAAIAMYILSPVPLFILSEWNQATMGLCFTLLLVAAATYLLMTVRKSYHNTQQQTVHTQREEVTSHQLRSRAVGRILGPVSLVVYLLVSFLTHAWYITWVIFPIFGCIQGLIKAILDLKEANQYEN